jgi:hypothetical protein
MTPKEIEQMLFDAGFNSGWALLGTDLTIWEHEAEPLAPLTRPVTEPPAKTAK